ncbi:MAG: copper chaperone [Bacteroidetes bacterium]|nr:MAG: copper chaperone [Bacteroidota bacterium]
MKTVKIFLTALLMVAAGVTASAQSHEHMNMPTSKTETFKVWGNCESCKARIEKAVKAEGATSADWNIKTKLLTVTFDPAKTSVDAFSKKLAAVGHDTEKYRADDKAYNALDACCQYLRAK